MRNYFLLALLGALLFTACQSEATNDSSAENSQEEAKDSLPSEDKIEHTDKIPNDITLYAVIDGPDEDFWINSYGDHSEDEVFTSKSIDIVPYFSENPGDISYEFRVLARDNFSLTYAGLENYSGEVNVYYDVDKAPSCNQLRCN